MFVKQVLREPKTYPLWMVLIIWGRYFFFLFDIQYVLSSEGKVYKQIRDMKNAKSGFVIFYF